MDRKRNEQFVKSVESGEITRQQVKRYGIPIELPEHLKEHLREMAKKNGKNVVCIPLSLLTKEDLEYESEESEAPVQ